jgi:acetylornithine deacetylase/succinyl-diaminopimelate desuccinylase-like protein
LIINPSIQKRILDLAVQIQQIPAATFYEQRRAEFVLKTWKEQGIDDAWMDDAGNVFTCLHSKGKGSSIVVSAHLDTVFPMETELTLRRAEDRIYGPGIGDNSVGLAGLFGLCWLFQGNRELWISSSNFPHDLWLVANVGEEGLGDLKGMQAVADRLRNIPKAYIVLEGMSLGQIYHRGLGVRRYKIKVRTRGGHSWIDYGKPSAIHELAELVVMIKDIPVSIEPRTSINIGTILGGTSVNTIAAEASCELDLRSESPQGLSAVIEHVLALIEEANSRNVKGVEVSAEVIGDRPTGEIPIDHPLVKLALDCHARHGINAKLNIASTDANVPLSRGLPAICIGLTTGGGAHTVGEYINTRPLFQGLSVLVDLIQAINNM